MRAARADGAATSSTPTACSPTTSGRSATPCRAFAEAELAPHVARLVRRSGTLPDRPAARRLGKLGLLGMHLEGYGCAGTTATAYGVACRELEAVDSGLRSLVSVQGSLAMYAIHRWGTEEQRQEWLPRMADRRGRSAASG